MLVIRDWIELSTLCGQFHSTDYFYTYVKRIGYYNNETKEDIQKVIDFLCAGRGLFMVTEDNKKTVYYGSNHSFQDKSKDNSISYSCISGANDKISTS